MALVTRQVGLCIVVSILVAANLTPAVAYTRPGQTQIASSNSAGEPTMALLPSSPIFPSLSGDGRFVAFSSDSPDLVMPDSNPAGVDTFLKDLRTGAIEVVSVTSDGSPALSPPTALSGADALSVPSVSRNGRFVAFTSFSPNLVPGDTNSCPTADSAAPAGTCPDIFVRDRKEGTTERISVASDGGQANNQSSIPSISDDGRFITFESLADNLVPDDTNQGFDVFVHDRRTKETKPVSKPDSGNQATCGAIDGSGRYVAFLSSDFPDPTYVAGGIGSSVYLRDLQTGDIEIISLDSEESVGRANCNSGGLTEGFGVSTGGRYVTFSADETARLAPNDTNDAKDIYVRDRELGRTERISVTSFGEQSGPHVFATSINPTISDDGRYVTWTTLADNLFSEGIEPPTVFVPGDWDVFVHDRVLGLTRLVSMTVDGTDGDCDDSVGPAPGDRGDAKVGAISGSGTTIAFISCDEGLTSHSDDSVLGTPIGWQVFARYQGPTQGTWTSAETPSPKPDGPPRSSETLGGSDKLGDALLQGADIRSARVVYREELDDLYFALELEKLARPMLPLAWFRFTTSDAVYEVRAQQISWGLPSSFTLFKKDSTGWEKVTRLRGGYGTTGERVVFSVPVEQVGLQDIGELSEVEAFTTLGPSFAEATIILDTLSLN